MSYVNCPLLTGTNLGNLTPKTYHGLVQSYQHSIIPDKTGLLQLQRTSCSLAGAYGDEKSSIQA